jgi:OOP family OmpA-OmpF porin
MMRISLSQKAVLTLAVLGAAAACPVAASAQDASGWYVSGAGSITMLNGTDGTIANAPAPGITVRTQNEFETGFGAQVAVGRDFGRFRLEAELGYTQDHQNHYVAVAPPTGRIPAYVDQNAARAMLNGYVDLTDGTVQPFLGAGAGVVRIHHRFFAPRAPFPTEAPRELINDNDTRFAYQLMAGLGIRVAPTVMLTAQYRWLDAGRFHGLDSRGERFERDHRGHNLDLGVRLRF